MREEPSGLSGWRPWRRYSLNVSSLPPSTLTALLGIRLGDGSLSDVLHQLVGVAQDAVEGADEVSTTLVRANKPFTAASTGPLALTANELQYDRGHGPCIEAGQSGTVLLVQDMRTETRWPDYAAAAVPHGVLSSLSVPLPLQTEIVGALDCYARTPAAFGEDQVRRAVELAGHVAVAVANIFTYTEAATRASQMEAAMASRSVIEQAKGIIMAQNHCDPESAFRILSRASQGRNIKLRDIAADLVARISTRAQEAPEH